MKKQKIDFKFISHSGRWLIESQALSFDLDEPASLVLTRENPKSKWLVVAVGTSMEKQDLADRAKEYKQTNPFSPEDFDINSIEATVRYYIHKALNENPKKGKWSRVIEIIAPPSFVGVFSIEGLERIPQKSIQELRDRFLKMHFFENLSITETPT